MKTWKKEIKKLKRVAIAKSRDMKEITSLNAQIDAYGRDINDILAEIGEYVIQNEILKQDDNVQEWTQQMILLREKIQEKRERIQEIKNIQICSRCGAEFPRNSRFCTRCGNEALHNVSLRTSIRKNDKMIEHKT